MSAETVETADALMKAADYIDEHGHHKGSFYYRGSVCVRGAINTVLYGDADNCGYDDSSDEAEQVSQVLVDFLGIEISHSDYADMVRAIGRWNDAPERTAKQVTTALRECAAELKGGAR